MVEGIRCYNEELIDFIRIHQRTIETISFYYGYKTIIIQAALVGNDGRYYEDCIISISASNVEYVWK